ncbi:MAG: glycosyltransferase [Myxococcaceae bacterium]|nr:MAG: glycosyltransferase [Myxococcaceae bacterium]
MSIADDDDLRTALSEAWTWPSPDAGFAMHVFFAAREPLPFPRGSLALPHADLRRLDQAPVLAAMGFAFSQGSPDDALHDRWARAFDRLTARAPFPADRASFVYQPIELLGICLGVTLCQHVTQDHLSWLRRVVAEAEVRLRDESPTSRLLGLCASFLISRPWHVASLPPPNELTVDEIALALWIEQAYAEIAPGLGINRPSFVRELLSRSDQDPPAGGRAGFAALRLFALARARSNTGSAPPSGSSLGGLAGPVRSLTILAIATEWSSGHGGLSTFNRELCRTCARIGHTVYCLVPSATDAELHQSASDGVHLLIAGALPGASDASRLLPRAPLPSGIVPDLIVGHGRVTGLAARVQHEQHFSGARRLHFVHVAPGAIEWFKDRSSDGDTAERADAREQVEAQLAKEAHVVAAVGPLLTREFATQLHGHGVPVREFLPGLPRIPPVEKPPPAYRCLVLGRGEDSRLKGFPIAARALGLVAKARPDLRPVLIARGAPAGTGDDLQDSLLKTSGHSALDVRVRPYTSDVQQIDMDLRQSSLVLMPSHSEGFGLVGLEAIAAGIPVLLSDQSGLAEVLQRLAPNLAPSHVVPVTRDLETDGPQWAKRIEFVFSDREAAFARVARLREVLLLSMSWDVSVTALLREATSG